MQSATLVRPSENYLQSYLEACREFKVGGYSTYSLHDPDAFDIWKDTIFDRYEKAALGVNLPEGFVPSTTFWLVEDGEWIGVGNIRHRLTPSLEQFGGHIGYAIRPSKWRQGYGALQLRLLLAEAAKLGIKNALITCDDANIGSYRVMEKNGGVYWDTSERVINGEPRMIRRYWVRTG